MHTADYLLYIIRLYDNYCNSISDVIDQLGHSISTNDIVSQSELLFDRQMGMVSIGVPT